VKQVDTYTKLEDRQSCKQDATFFQKKIEKCKKFMLWLLKVEGARRGSKEKKL
jgi:hypothetical protein